MKRILIAVPLIMFAATPAAATGGYQCRPLSGAGPVLTLVVGHSAAPAMVGATLSQGRRILSTSGRRDPLVIGQSWIDERYLWADLVDAEANRYEARLRARFQPKLKGRPAIGTLQRGGRTYRVRCVEA